MADEHLIQVIEQALADLKAGKLDSLDSLINSITVGDIEYSQGIAIGQNIQQVVVIIQAEHPEAAARLKAAKKELDTRFKLPDIPQVAPDARVRRRAATRKVFISYSHADTLAVNQIARRLNEEHYYDIWIDYDSIPLGNRWKEEIARGIIGAERMLFMASPASLASPACRKEIRYARDKGRTIIPVRLTTALSWEDLHEVGLDEQQGIDFSGGASDSLWEKLLDNLPKVSDRDHRRMKPAFRELHVDYLRSLFRRYGWVDLTTLIDEVPRREVSLLDVYVPLYLGYGVSVEVRDRQMADWWVTDGDGRPADTSGAAEHEPDPRPKEFPGVRARPEEMALLVERIREGVSQAIEEGRLDSRPRWRREESPEPDGEHDYWVLESEEAPAISPHLVVTGDPGSGKSTLLRHMVLCMAGDQLLDMAQNDAERKADLDELGWWPHMAYTPVFIELRDLVSRAFPPVDDDRPLDEAITLDLLLGYLRDYRLGESLAGYLDDLRGQMRDGDVMFFLDGLDEVPAADQPKRREQVRALVRILKDQFPACRILITSRPYAYRYGWGLEEFGFGHVELAPLRPYRLEQLARKLFAVVLGPAEVEQQAGAFKEQVQKLPEELRQSPLFFTLLAAIWLNNQRQPVEERLPMSKGAIYRQCLDMAFRRWTKKDLQGQSVAQAIGIDEPLLRKLLEAVGYHVQQQVSGDAAGQFEAGLLLNLLRPMGIKGLDYDLLLETLAQRAGVIYEADPGDAEQGRPPLFSFAHPSFREHLATCHLACNPRYPALAARHLVETPNLWRNVFELLPDEVARAGCSLWELLAELLPRDAPELVEPDDPAWYRLYYAGRLLAMLRGSGDERLEIYEFRLRDALVEVVTAGALSPGDRAEIGRLLSELDDPRRGVGVRDGLPDIDWVAVPAGKFIYQDGEERDESIFYIARYPITHAQYQALLDAEDGYQKARWWDYSPEAKGWREEHPDPVGARWRLSNHPRETVTWYEAVAFSRWLTEKAKTHSELLPEGVQLTDGWQISLPTEWQWEKAARGGLKLPDGEGGWKDNPAPRREYPYEGDFDATKWNTVETGIGRTSAVGIFPQGASPYGVLDMSGNVWEWCLNESGTPENTGVRGDAGRVVRGGSWLYNLVNARASCRRGDYPSARLNDRGFRVVCGRPPSR